MDCYCASSTLYQRDKLKAFKYLNSKSNEKEKYEYCRSKENQVHDVNLSEFQSVYEQTLDIGSTTYPSQSIPEIEYESIVQDPLKFYKEYIAMNKPCKILNAINDWPAHTKWTDLQYLKDKISNHQITIDLTPDGFADSIYNKFFAQPKQLKATFSEFLAMKPLKNQGKLIPYIQKQNGNLSSEFSFLLEDITKEQSQGDSKSKLPDVKQFFKEKFFNNQEPDSINFWMGYSDTVSSLHKDPYENIYAVIQGEKHFTLLPPTILPYARMGKYKNCKWNCSADYEDWWLEDVNQGGEAHQDNEENQDSQTVWYSLNPDLKEDHIHIEELPQYHVIIKAGEVLYLPSLWFHQVTQYADSSNQMDDKAHSDDFIIAANFWYDMEFDHKFQVLDILHSLVKKDMEKQTDIQQS